MYPFQILKRFADRLCDHFERWAFQGLPFFCEDYEDIQILENKH